MKGASTHAGYLADLGLVIVTRPSITMELLASAEEFGCRNFWLQPGTYDDAVLERLSELKEKGYCTSAVFGPGSDSGGDWCVLIDGEDALKAGGNWDEKRVAESKEMMANLIAIKDKAIKDDEQYAKGAAVRYDKMGAFFGADEVPHRFWRSKKTPQEVRRAKARELNERNIL